MFGLDKEAFKLTTFNPIAVDLLKVAAVKDYY
jgi:hypothetical protein